MYAMFYKFVAVFSLVIIVVQLLEASQAFSSGSSQSQMLTNSAKGAFLPQEEVPCTLERFRTNSCSPDAIEDLIDENVRLHREVASLQDALKAAELGILKVGIPEGTLPLVDKIRQKVAILQVLRMWRDDWEQGSRTHLSIFTGSWF